jgi:hypothetical protein
MTTRFTLDGCETRGHWLNVQVLWRRAAYAALAPLDVCPGRTDR